MILGTDEDAHRAHVVRALEGGYETPLFEQMFDELAEV
jgi:hypothetical protein